MAETELLQWAASMGISDGAPQASSSSPCCLGRSLMISHFPSSGGRGLAAARDLAEGELILTVPRHALLNIYTAKEDPDFATAWRHHQGLSSTQVLTAYLLRELGKGRASRWYSYLKSLPRSYHTLAQYSGFEIQALQLEDAVWTAERAVEKAGKDWREARPLLHMLGLKDRLSTFRAWLWASATVSSRTLHVPWDNAGTLCPIGDLFNYAPAGALFKEGFPQNEKDDSVFPAVQSLGGHRSVDQSAFYRQEGNQPHEVNDDTGGGLHFTDRLTDGGYDANLKTYCFYAREDYKKGDQVLLCYGLYTNLELLEHYGFVLPQNPNDKVYISLHSFKDFTRDLEFIWSHKVDPHCSMHIQVDGRPSFHLLAALRLCCTSAGVRKCRGHLAFSGLQISTESDVASYQRLKERCISLLTSFSTTVDMDTALMHIIALCSSIDGLVGLLELLTTSREMGNLWMPGQVGFKLLEDSICGWITLSERSQQQVLEEMQSLLQFHRESLSDARTSRVKSEGELLLQRWWLSVQWRMCHKMILQRCISICNQQLQLLSLAEK